MNLTSYVQDRQLTIALRGEIDHHAAREIMQALSAKIDLYLPLRCILDFRDVTFMDSPHEHAAGPPAAAEHPAPAL